VRDGVKRIDSLIHDLLEYSRVVQTATDQHPVDAERIARQAVELCRTSVHESHATIEIATLPAVLAVDAQVLQVFQNLISNALKYRRDGVAPLIRIAGEPQGGQILFKVEDNDIGFDPQYAKKVFKLFTRLNGRQYPGTGLGLAICQRIVEQYGGRIWADSRVGEGSTFSFTLPATIMKQ